VGGLTALQGGSHKRNDNGCWEKAKKGLEIGGVLQKKGKERMVGDADAAGTRRNLQRVRGKGEGIQKKTQRDGKMVCDRLSFPILLWGKVRAAKIETGVLLCLGGQSIYRQILNSNLKPPARESISPQNVSTDSRI